MTRILVTSDFHGYLPPDLPDTDLLIIAGDVTGFDPEHRHPAQWIADEFEPWLERQSAEWVVGIAGNHDFVAQANPDVFRDLPWLYLQDEAADVGGFRIYGAPWSNRFFEWAFMDGDDALAARWAAIPADTEILVVHGPARGANDQVASGLRVGSVALRRRLRELPDLRLLVSGHIHEAYGTTYLPMAVGADPAGRLAPLDAAESVRWVTAVNGTYVDERYRPGNKPIEVELIPRKNEQEALPR